MNSPTRRGIIGALSLTGLSATLIVGLALARNEARMSADVAGMAMPVSTRPLELRDTYVVQRRFTGRVQARRQSVLGFELSGRLARVLVDEGDRVERGALLAELDTGRLAAKRDELLAAQAKAEADLALAGATLKRVRGIVDKGGVSRQELDEAREGWRAAKAALALAGQRIDSLDVELDKSRLRAPFAGSLVARRADEGQVLDAGHPLLTLQEDSLPEIRVGVAGRVIAQLEPGRHYRLRWRDTELTARLRALLPVRAATARTVDALFDPLATEARLLPGDIVTLALDRRVEQRGSWLPITALTEGERGLWSLYVADPLAAGESAVRGATHRIVRRSVDVLHQSAERVYVRGALHSDKQVVVNGLQRIVPGQQVRLADARLARAGGGHD